MVGTVIAFIFTGPKFHYFVTADSLSGPKFHYQARAQWTIEAHVMLTFSLALIFTVLPHSEYSEN